MNFTQRLIPILCVLFSVLIPFITEAQKKDVPKINKWGYIDSDLILSKMPDYQEAKEEINLLSKSWREELRVKYKEIESLLKDFQEESILFSSEVKKERLEEIKSKEDSLNAYRNEIFGFNGIFFQKEKEILKTVQDKLFDAVEVVADEFKLQTIFDKAGDENIIYVNPIHDYSDYVLEKLGLGDPNDKVR